MITNRDLKKNTSPPLTKPNPTTEPDPPTKPDLSTEPDPPTNIDPPINPDSRKFAHFCFKVYSFQLQGLGRVLYCYFSSLPRSSTIG